MSFRKCLIPCWAGATAAQETTIKACYPPSLWSRDMKEASHLVPWVGLHWKDMKGLKMSCSSGGRNRWREAAEHQWVHAGVSTRSPEQAWGSPALRYTLRSWLPQPQKADCNNPLRQRLPKGGLESESEAQLWFVFNSPRGFSHTQVWEPLSYNKDRNRNS